MYKIPVHQYEKLRQMEYALNQLLYEVDAMNLKLKTVLNSCIPILEPIQAQVEESQAVEELIEPDEQRTEVKEPPISESTFMPSF